MNKATRLLTVTGMGALTALAIGAGPAQAAGTTGSAAAKPSAGQAQQHHGWERTVGYFRSIRACEVAGHIGERFGRWDDHDCEPVRFGFRRGSWALEVSRDRDRGHFGHGMPGHEMPWHGMRDQDTRDRDMRGDDLSGHDMRGDDLSGHDMRGDDGPSHQWPGR
jgi:hypothetical protein